MLGLSDFFEKFKKIDKGRRAWRQEIINSISTYSKVVLKPEDIVVNENGVVRITNSPIRRMEIMMFKDKIIVDLNTKGVKVVDLV